MHPRLILALLLLLCAAVVSVDAQQTENRSADEGERISFFVVGDWGTGGRGARRVGQAMAAEHLRRPVQAVISTGDNIYPKGVSSIDDPQWRSKFENVYPAEKLPVPFWAVLGNHDYRLNPQAEVEYTGKRLPNGSVTRWHMPGRFWSTRFASSDGSFSTLLIGLDTQQLVAGAGKRRAHLALLDSVLGVSEEDEILVVGHHPVYSHGHYGDNKAMRRHVEPRLREHGVLAYLNGHEHDLQLLRRIEGVRYIISGGGGGVRKTRAGKNTEYAKGALGFFRLDITRTAFHIKVLSDRGVLLYETTDTLPQR